MHYLVAGAGSPMVLFESGGGGGLAMSDLPLLRRVAAFTRGCIYDRAGLGWSDPGPADRNFEERAGDLHALLPRAGEKGPFVLVGSSFGGLGARAFCRAYPGEVAGMVLVDAAEEAKYFPTMRRMRAFHEDELRLEAGRALTGELSRDLDARLSGVRAFSEVEKSAMLELFSRPDHHLASLEELSSALDLTPPELQAAGGFGELGDRPLVVLSHGVPYAGEMAVWEEGFTESQARLAGLSANSAHVVVPGAGHSIGLERPDIVTAAIEAVVTAVRGGEPLNANAVDALVART
jgi:pimeloyl-ACP methyl ester carboxylesterase